MLGFRKHKSLLVISRSFSYLNSEEVPVINTPKYVLKYAKQNAIKETKKRLAYVRKKSQCGNLSVPIVTCRNGNLNHYQGQVYGKFQTIPLASKGWRRTKYWDDYFIINRHSENPSLTDSKTKFSDFPLKPQVLEAIDQLGFKHPSTIQTMAIPKILQGGNTVCCAETGSGKTLSYLAPLLHQIINDRDRLSHQLPPNTPLGLVLVPGRELGNQIADFALNIAPHCGISVDVLISGYRPKNKFYTSGSELVVATLGMMCKLTALQRYNLNFVQHIVLDECDTMVDDTFSDDLQLLFRDMSLKGSPDKTESWEESASNTREGVQLVLVGATMPRNLNDVFDEYMDPQSLTWIETEHLHKIMPHVTQVFLRLDPMKKCEKLVQLLKEELAQRETTNDNGGIIVFVNRGKACYFLSKTLKENGVPNLPLSGENTFEERKENYESFLNGEIDILVATDLGSRGLDTTRANHIINFEFPNDISDYIHRSGRVGRVGSSEGRVTNFISIKYEVPLVQEIEATARLPFVKSLPNVDANIRRRIEEYHRMKNATSKPKNISKRNM